MPRKKGYLGNEFEEYFKKIDDPFDKLLLKLVEIQKESILLTQDERKILTKYLSFQIYRNSLYRNNLEGIFSTTFDLLESNQRGFSKLIGTDGVIDWAIELKKYLHKDTSE